MEPGIKESSLTLFRMEMEGDKKTHYIISLVTFTNVGISLQSFLTFSFNPFAKLA